MTNTKYIISSRKVIAVALAIVMFAMMFVGCTKNEPVNNDGTTITESTTSSQSGESTTLADNQTGNEESTTLADENNENENNTSTGGTETTTKKNISTGSSNKVTTTKSVTTTTSKVAQATCSHSWGEWKWSSAKECMISTCSKCGATMTPDDCNHTYGNWEYRYDSKYRKCTKCPHSETIEGDFTAQCMGSKSEYLELLGYVNEARREAGLNELVYVNEFQSGANTRAQELTVKFSHTRPNGLASSSVYNFSIWGTSEDNYCYSEEGYNYMSGGENIVSGASTAKQAFNAWMSSSSHRGAILRKGATHFVAARCDTYWVMSVFGPCDDIFAYM